MARVKSDDKRPAQRRGTLGRAAQLVARAFSDWREDNATRLAAALAFYTALSIAPLLIVVIAITGLAFGQDAAKDEILGQVRSLLGAGSADTIQSMIEGANKPRTGVIATVLGVGVLLFGASGVFGELQESLNTIWEVQPKPGRGVLGVLRDRFLSFTMVLGLGFLLLVALVVSAGLSAAGSFVEGALPGGTLLWQAVTFVVSLAITTVLFALIFKVLPDVEIGWRDVWIGAAATAVLFTGGKLLISLYIGRAGVASTYGAAGSVIVFLIWVYYSAQILFFGAELTQAYARLHGSRIVPDEDAMPLPDGEHPERSARSPQTDVPARAPKRSRELARA